MTGATGVGSWPGTDVREALRAVRDLHDSEAGDVPYLPELPARGPGADMVGRAAGLLLDLAVDLQPSGWRLVDRPGRDLGRTLAFRRQDLDELAEAYDGWQGPLKVQVCGPWTLAASVELTRGERVLTHPGATRDLAESLTLGVTEHLAAVARVVPGARIVVQLDEPGLPAVLAGRLPTASGYGRVPAVDRQQAGSRIQRTVEHLRAAGAAEVWLHGCAPGMPLTLVAASGVDAISVDTSLLSAAEWEDVAELVDGGTRFVLGAVPADRPDDWRGALRLLRDGWGRTGAGLPALARQRVSPACGLAGLSPAEAVSATRSSLALARETTEAGPS